MSDPKKKPRLRNADMSRTKIPQQGDLCSLHREIKLADERGSALVLVMFIALLFTLLGVTVLSATVGGAQRTETRKNEVQSLHLAEKTLEETIAYMTAELEGIVKDSINEAQGDLEQDIDTYLQTLRQGTEQLPASTELTRADGRILDISYERVSAAGQPSSYIVNLTAEAMVNGVKRELVQEITFDTYPDFLKYTLGSEGNVILNGSPQIRGNIYAGKGLYINDQAEYLYQSSQLKRMASSPFELQGEAHVQSLDGMEYTRNGRTWTAAELDREGVTWTGVIPLDQILIKNQRKFVQINVRESFIDKVVESIGAPAGGDILRQNVRGRLNGGLTELLKQHPAFYDAPEQLPLKPEVPEYPEGSDPDAEGLSEEEAQRMRESIEQWSTYREGIQRFTRPARSLVYEGDVVFDGVELTGIEAGGANAWYVVDGNVKIDNFSDQPLRIAANMLITGRLEIRGNVELDSTIFVLGAAQNETSTLVEDASISGLGVIMSEGPILVNRHDAFQDTVRPLNAFFYTDASAELYGVGSIFSLKGGFFAKGDLTVNAIRGRATAGSGDIDVDPSSELIRFQAEYDSEVYLKQADGLPRVNQISVKAGNLRLK
ncbi:hypothetical protein E6C60_3833 [Paenibacillus algicola]|uniref:Uncharacterized protein n=1 Tax=Paenibacillus algicola TaxID=2565926 RepID=A0A4P8XPF9_9BACL|nr:hypothetical protein [Paenibacillus algicola]QCT04538.1 hypothetical protein E6C60_3833 [Paenibacillus algicola]